MLGIILIIAALAVAIIPQFTDCESQGKAITLVNDNIIAMKCHWKAQAEIPVAACLMLVGIAMTVSKRKESYKNHIVPGLFMGVLVLLISVNLIGVCQNPGMICNSVMKTALSILGSVIIKTKLVCLLVSQKSSE